MPKDAELNRDIQKLALKIYTDGGNRNPKSINLMLDWMNEPSVDDSDK